MASALLLAMLVPDDCGKLTKSVTVLEERLAKRGWLSGERSMAEKRLHISVFH